MATEENKKAVAEEAEKAAEEAAAAAEAEAEETENTEGGEQTAIECDGEKLKAELEAMKDKMMRHAAEFDNFKKRTQKEREELYLLAVCDTVEKILPVKDNLERAVAAADGESDGSLNEGVRMILKQLEDVLSAMGVEKIKTVGETFDPELHNAVMHEENGDFGENTVSEELMGGYTCKGKVVRFAMVKVAN